MNQGWYTDPSMPSQRRYWDGQQWTSHVQPMLPAPMPGYGPATYGQPPSYGVAAKNPAVSLLISFFIPGVGSMVNGDVGIGVAILMGYLVSWVLTLVLIGFLGLLAFWVWGMVDAYTGAQRWNRRHGIVS